MDFEVMYRAMDSRDRRFDGRFFVAVTSTGIYCRPICPAPTPKRKNTRFYRYAAVAELDGFRPCRRCRPEVSPDTPEWDTRADLVGRGLRLIAEGAVDELGLATVANRLGVSDRHLQRVFKSEVGTTPGAIARSRRARLARQLLTETSMPVTQVAFAAGFSSVRTFNETISQIYKVTPTELRRGTRSDDGAIRLELPYRPPLAASALLAFLRDRAIPGVEEVTDISYRRSIGFGDGHAMIELAPMVQTVTLIIDTDQIAPLAPVVQRSRQLFDLDADPETIRRHLAQSASLRPLLAGAPGIRLVGAFDPFETGVHIILDQTSSLAAARRKAGRIAAAFGTPLPHPTGTISRLFPTPAQLAAAELTAIGLGPRVAATLVAFSSAVSNGEVILDGSVDPDTATRQLLAIEGIGPHTAAWFGMRSLRDPDSFPLADATVSRRLEAIGTSVAASVESITEPWRPWRGYAAMYLSS